MLEKKTSNYQDLLDASEKISKYLIVLRRNAKDISDREQRRLIESMCTVIDDLRQEVSSCDLLVSRRQQAIMLYHLYEGLTKPSFDASQAFLNSAIELSASYQLEREKMLFLARFQVCMAVLNLTLGIVACMPPATPLAVVNFSVAAFAIVTAIHAYDEVARIDRKMVTLKSRGDTSLDILRENYREVNTGNSSLIAKERMKTLKELDENQEKEAQNNDANAGQDHQNPLNNP